MTSRVGGSDIRHAIRLSDSSSDGNTSVTQITTSGALVHAETPQARDFYLHLIPEFEPSPTDDLHLVLLMKDILRTLRA